MSIFQPLEGQVWLTGPDMEPQVASQPAMRRRGGTLTSLHRPPPLFDMDLSAMDKRKEKRHHVSCLALLLHWTDTHVRVYHWAVTISIPHLLWLNLLFHIFAIKNITSSRGVIRIDWDPKMWKNKPQSQWKAKKNKSFCVWWSTVHPDYCYYYRVGLNHSRRSESHSCCKFPYDQC